MGHLQKEPKIVKGTLSQIHMRENCSLPVYHKLFGRHSIMTVSENICMYFVSTHDYVKQINITVTACAVRKRIYQNMICIQNIFATAVTQCTFDSQAY